MTELFSVRVEKSLLKEAKKVSKEIGTSPEEIVRLLLAQLVKGRRIPFSLTADAPAPGLVDSERRNQIWRDLDDAEGW